MARRSSHRFRAFDVHARPNKGKAAEVAKLLPLWQRALVHMQHLMVREMRRGIQPGWRSVKGMPDYLTHGQWSSVASQTAAALRAWQGQAAAAMTPLITALDVPDDERARLRELNSARTWWSDPTLAAMITRLARTDLPFPNLSRVRTLQLDATVAHLEPSKTPHHAAWLRVTIPHAAPVRIPLAGSPYADQQPGERRRLIQLTVGEDGALTVRMIKRSPLAPPRPDSGGTIGLDWGLDALLTASDGRRLGQGFFGWLRARDGEIQALEAALHEARIPLLMSKRYRRLQHRIRAHAANELGRIVNQLGDDLALSAIVVEALDFRSRDDFSPTMRRLVTRAGRAVLRQRLAELSEDRGIEIVEVAAPYTSQECSGCGYTDGQNRRGPMFECRFCGLKLHADVNAARVIRRRRSTPVAAPHTSARQILAHLDAVFLARWGFDPRRLRERLHAAVSAASRRQPAGRVNRARDDNAAGRSIPHSRAA